MIIVAMYPSPFDMEEDPPILVAKASGTNVALKEKK
jgi:hypothetical protein